MEYNSLRFKNNAAKNIIIKILFNLIFIVAVFLVMKFLIMEKDLRFTAPLSTSGLLLVFVNLLLLVVSLGVFDSVTYVFAKLIYSFRKKSDVDEKHETNFVEQEKNKSNPKSLVEYKVNKNLRRSVFNPLIGVSIGLIIILIAEII